MDAISLGSNDINVESIDKTKEHDELRRLIDQVYALMTGEPTGNNYIDEIVAAVEAIGVVFTLHCEHEELVMYSTGCAGLDEHQRYHRHVQNILAAFVAILKVKLFPITSNTASHVKQWLTFHIMKHDVDFRNNHA